MAMIINKRKEILKKIIKVYEEEKANKVPEKEIFNCEFLKNYKKSRIDKY